jgi:hypothetical protein
MNQDPVRISQIHWTKVFPFLRLFEASSLGCGLTVLLLGYVGLVVSWTGSGLLNRFLSDGSITAVCEFPWPEYSRAEGNTPLDIGPVESLLTTNVLPSTLGSLSVSATRVCFEGQHLIPVAPFRPVSSTSWMLSLDLMVWNALVLCFFGTAIARTTATQFCHDSRTGLLGVVKFSGSQLRQSLLSTGLILLFLAILRGLLFAADLMTRLGSIGQLAASLIWGLLVLISVALTLTLLLGGAAWLLSLSAISTDRCTGAEALSRSISYVLSHRLKTIFGFVIVTGLALLLRWLLELLVAAGMNGLPVPLREGPSNGLRRIWGLAIELIPHAAHLSVFLSGTTILYVLLRNREDGISVEEIDGAA